MKGELPRRLSVLSIVCVLALCYYRAKTQSLSVDEAWVFNSFVNEPLSAMGRYYDACNHVLHTLLMKLSRSSLGTSELVLRIPSLLAALLYCIAVYRLTLLLLSGWTQLLAVALLTLHPLILDFLIAARGYGLALALFVWVLYLLSAWYLKGFDTKLLQWAGVCAGLSIGANLTFAVPLFAVGLMLLVLSSRRGAQGFWNVVDSYAGPAVTIGFLIVVVPMLHAAPEHFYFGVDDLQESVSSLVGGIVKVEDRWPGASAPVWVPWTVLTVVPLSLILLGFGVVRTLWRSLPAARQPVWIAPFVLIAGTLVLSALTLLVLHAALEVKYPHGRTGLYFIPLFFLSLLLGTKLLDGGKWKWTRGAVHLALWMVALTSIWQTDNRYFLNWKFDASTANLLAAMQDDVGQRFEPSRRPVSVGTNSFLEQTIRYYRTRRKLIWMTDPETGKLNDASCQYYLLTAHDAPLIQKLGLELVRRDSLSGAFVARRPQ